MQKSQVVLGFLVPAYQEPAKPIHPAMRAFNDPATCLLASVLAQLLGLFATRPDVRGEANFTQEVAHFVVVVTQGCSMLLKRFILGALQTIGCTDAVADVSRRDS